MLVSVPFLTASSKPRMEGAGFQKSAYLLESNRAQSPFLNWLFKL